MKFIQVSETDLVNVKVIDSQHLSIAELINSLNESLSEGNSRIKKGLFVELLSEIEIHFSSEEKLMKDNIFSGYISHKLEHDRFIKKHSVLYKSIKSGTEFINLELLSSLRKWFFNHLELNDKKLGTYLNSKGIY
jgi:hemerythrin-like metal-binding protein